MNAKSMSPAAFDLHGLDALKRKASREPEQALKTAAQQFEALFVNSMLKSMRDATPQDALFGSEHTRLYTSMLDQQFAQKLASRGLGLADVLERQLRGAMAPALESAQGATSSPAPPSAVASPPERRAAVKPGLLEIPSLAVHSSVPNRQKDFLTKLTPHAQRAADASGIPASFMLGQAALESGWGKREIRAPDGAPTYNLFGIKAGSKWQGKVVEVATTEYVNGEAVKKVQKFRAYSSYAEAFGDYAKLLTRSGRYADAMRSRHEPVAFAQALARAGYATDPQYADKLTRILSSPALRSVA